MSTQPLKIVGKRGLFGYRHHPKMHKWSHIRVHGLKIGPNFAKFQCAAFSIRKMWENDNMVEKTQKCRSS